jgi:hypothetical protein
VRVMELRLSPIRHLDAAVGKIGERLHQAVVGS